MRGGEVVVSNVDVALLSRVWGVGLGEVVWRDNKQLLDEVFVIYRIIKVEVRVISRSRRYTILDITKTDLIINLLYIERKKSCFCFFTESNPKRANLT